MSQSSQISVRNARQHNLKGIDIDIPKNALVVVTGLSGSGKTSLAVDTVYAEGQRRYIESLSSYARQFVGKLDKPLVDEISGITPSIAIFQKVISTNSRSTVGSTTELQDYLKLLFARVGRIFSPTTNEEIIRQDIPQVIQFIHGIDDGEKLYILSEIPETKFEQKYKHLFLDQGYSRIWVDGEIIAVEDWNFEKGSHLVIDRLKWSKTAEDISSRLRQSLEAAFFEGKGRLSIALPDKGGIHSFSKELERDGIQFLEPHPDLFSTNSPYGICPSCQGYGDILGVSESLIFPDTSLSLNQHVIAFMRFDSLAQWNASLFDFCSKHDIDTNVAWENLPKEHQRAVWKGDKYFQGIQGYLDELEKKSHKISHRIMLSRFRGRTTCTECQGKKLRKEALYIKVSSHDIGQLYGMSLKELYSYFTEIQLDMRELKIADRILKECKKRIQTLIELGLGYLQLDRKSKTLSGGESQRIRLSNALHSALVNTTYILDEPSIGLHPHNTEQLLATIVALRDLGNTVIVIEHDEDVMRAADHIIDVGPEAGTKGGTITFSGALNDLLKTSTPTAQYLSGKLKLKRTPSSLDRDAMVSLNGSQEHNLKNIDIEIPTQCLSVVSGMSGSGKSTLIGKILYPALAGKLGVSADQPGNFKSIAFPEHLIEHVEYVHQNSLGRSSRSNAITYLDIYTDIRNLMAKTGYSKAQKLTAKHFSFNVAGGRCETCEGDGEITIEMQFLSDVKVQCEECNGKRFSDNVLQAEYHGKNIDDLLCMTVQEATDFFHKHEEKKIARQLQILVDVGLDYITLGQSSSTLSGGESQRVKLAYFLMKKHGNKKTLFIFDEPTTGLHFQDIQKLLHSFDALIEMGHTVVVIEHHTDVISLADWVIDLGPYGGDEGGQLLYQGSPKGLKESTLSVTAKYL